MSEIIPLLIESRVALFAGVSLSLLAGAGLRMAAGKVARAVYSRGRGES
jgi:hypothetical protein